MTISLFAVRRCSVLASATSCGVSLRLCKPITEALANPSARSPQPSPSAPSQQQKVPVATPSQAKNLQKPGAVSPLKPTPELATPPVLLEPTAAPALVSVAPATGRPKVNTSALHPALALIELGFTGEEAVSTLAASNGDVEDSATLLFEKRTEAALQNFFYRNRLKRSTSLAK